MTPGPHIEVSIDSPGWEPALPDADLIVRRAARAAWLAMRKGDGDGVELSIVLSDDASVRKLNNAWRGQDRPTNVLSFPNGEADGAGRPVLLGDVVLALETIVREADDGRRTLADHVSHLVVHGVLHLMGCDHDTDAKAASMETLEIRILSGLGVDRSGTGI